MIMGTIESLRAAAESNDFNAMYYLGTAYALGKEVEKNDEEALKWYLKAAPQNAEAAFNAAMMYKDGLGTDADLEKALELFCTASSKGIAAASFQAGAIYLKRGMPEKAVGYFKKAAEAGLAEAQHNYGMARLRGDGIEQDCGEAVTWLTKSASQGNTISALRLGRMYLTGSGVLKDRQEAVKWYRTAGSPLADMVEESERGSSERKFALSAVLDETAENNEDLAEAFQMCREAAECGYSPAAAALGKMYEWGRGTGKDYTEAVRWYTTAAENGSAEAMHDLASMYALGNGVPQDYEAAVKWSEKAALCGNASAAYTLGVAYRDGWGVKPDEEKSFEWFLKGAELDSIESQYEAAVIFSRKGNEDEAVKWMSKAARQGHLGAMMALRERDENAIFKN